MSLDEMEQKYVPILASLNNQNLPKPFYEKAFRPEDLGVLYKIVPLVKKSYLTLLFQFDYQLDEENTFMLSSYISSLIGHEGPESLLADLKADGLGRGLTSKRYIFAPGLLFAGLVKAKKTCKNYI